MCEWGKLQRKVCLISPAFRIGDSCQKNGNDFLGTCCKPHVSPIQRCLRFDQEWKNHFHSGEIVANRRMKSYPSHDVTGFPRIRRGASFQNGNNQQRFVVCAMYNLLISKGVEKEEAAKDCGYSMNVIETWNRYFHGII